MNNMNHQTVQSILDSVMEDKDLKNCPCCKLMLRPSNVKFNGRQELGCEFDLFLFTCNACGSTASVKVQPEEERVAA